MSGCKWAAGCIAVLLSVWLAYVPPSRSAQSKFHLGPLEPPVFLPPLIGHKLGPYSPYYAVAPYEAPGEDCILAQAHLLYRHGARFPTQDVSIKLARTIRKLQAAELRGALKFIEHYEYSFGVGDLVPFGAMESSHAGRQDFSRYVQPLSRASSVGRTISPFLRATSSQRVIDSAGNWSAAFSAASRGTIHIPPSLILEKRHGFNNSLSTHNCPKWNKSLSISATEEFVSSFTPDILHRLERMAPTASLRGDDVINLFHLCAFDSVVSMEYSPFCQIFEPHEFDGIEYYEDLRKYYHTGYGHRLGPVQGVAYVTELIARLTSSPVDCSTNVNQTLDSSDITFPLDRTLYVDFSHDNTMAAIVSAMGIHKPRKHLPTRKQQTSSEWVFSRIAPFAGRLAVEKYTCQARTGSDMGEWVRVLSDDAVVDLPECQESMPGGLCSLQSFIQHQLAYVQSRQAIDDWNSCFEL